MRHTILLLLIITQSLTAQWSDEISLNSGINEGYLWPRIDMTGGNAFVLWGNKANRVIYGNLVENGQPGSVIELNSHLKNAFITDWASTEMNADGHNIAVVYKSSNAEKGDSYFIFSNDGGKTFTDPVSIIKGDSVLHRFPEVLVKGTDIYISFMHFEPGWADPQYVMIHSADAGLNFSDLLDVTANYGGESCDCCVSNLLGDDQNLILLFRNNDNNFRDIYAARSERSQLNFNQFNDLNLATWELFACPASGADGVINGNMLYTAFMSGHTGRNQIFLSGLDMNTDQLVHDRPLLDSLGPHSSYNYPRMAGNKDTIGLVWQEQSARDIDVYFSYSTNGLEDLGKEIFRVSESSLGRQLNPDIAFHNGRFHFTWQDNGQALVQYRTYDLSVLSSTSQVESTNIELFPSPAEDHLFVETKSTWTCARILDVNGREMRKFYGQKAMVSGLLPGIYFIELQLDNGNREIGKFIKK